MSASAPQQEEVEVQRTASHLHVAHLSVQQFSAVKSAERKVFRRVLIPCLLLMVVNYLDRQVGCVNHSRHRGCGN